MLILQAGLMDGRLLLWGETSPRTPPATPAPRGRRPRTPQPRPFPFDPGAGRLTQGLPFPATRAEETTTALVWLPTVGNQPVPSSPLLGQLPEPGGKAALAPWQATVLPLSPARALDLLCGCMGQDTLQPGVLVGKTLAYLAHVVRYAGALVAREQFIPDLRQSGTTWRACWRPVLTGVDVQRRLELARAMPPACRALGLEPGAAPDRPALTLLSDFLDNLVDALVRATGRGPSAQALPGRASRSPKPEAPSPHDAWLAALRSSDGALTGKPAELKALAGQVRDWQRPLAISAAAPFRLSFRLEEPGDDSNDTIALPRGQWQVRYLLQAHDDPSLLVPAADAWKNTGRLAGLFRQRSFNAHEYLLTALGQAAGLCPPIEASLQAAHPAGYATDAGSAHAFLTEHAGLLEQAGFGVLLPGWWTGKGTKLRLSVRASVKSPKMQGGSGMSLEDIVQLSWQVALGDEPLTRQELDTLARLKMPLVKVRGQWVQVSADEIQAASAFWKKQKTGKVTARQVLQMVLDGVQGPAGLEVSGVSATGWIRDLLAQLEGKAAFTELTAPSGLRATLRPYQVRGYSWLAFLRQWGLGACLADDMGLGKTLQALTLIQRDREQNGRRPVLLVCPTSVMGNWRKEAERFAPELPVLVHHGQKRPRGDRFAKTAGQQALVVTSYALLHRDADLLGRVKWAGVMLDEAQNIKNPETRQARAARGLTADYRVALTGTPVENHVGDLWSIMEFLNPGLLGTQADFRRRFFLPIQAQRDPAAAERLRRLTGPFILRRLKTDRSIIADLPDKVEGKVFCTLTREQVSLYAALVEEASKALEGAEGIKRKGVILGLLSKLKQVCNHPAQFLGEHSPLPGRSGKLTRLTEMVEEVLEADDRALIFTQFTEMGGLIQRHLQETFGHEVLFLHGGLQRKQRDQLVERFQAGGEASTAETPRLFILSLKAGGTGLNLTAANHVFHFDRWWNPAVENQATDRAFRIGQKRKVLVHKLLCVGTLEEKIDEMIQRKEDVAGRIVGSGEGWLTELSNEQLKDLLTLRPEALGE